MANPTTGELVLRKVWDENTQSLKVTIGSSEFAVALSAEENDSIITYPNATSVSGETELSAVGMKSACLYVEPGSGNAKLQVSPVDSGDLWMDLADSQVTAGGTLVSTEVLTLCARRIKVVLTGSPVVHLIVQAV